jgi:two-component sensor histidine kinase
MQVAQHLGLVLHELATNARKHGALSAPEGKVDSNWSLIAAIPPAPSLRWVEQEGPPVPSHESKGFGLIMIERGMRHVGAQVTLTFATDGVCCDVLLPLCKAAESLTSSSPQ